LLTRVITDAIAEGLKARTTTSSADVKPAAVAEAATADLENAILEAAAPAETPEA
jgi:small subunit ribosomal protein S2